MTAILGVAAVLVLVPVLLALLTRVFVARTEARHPPIGEMVDCGGVRLHALRVAGRGDESSGDESGKDGGGEVPLLFIHGASGNLLDQYHAFAASLPPGRLALFVDRPGQGHSERGGPENDTPDGQADALARLLDAWRIDRVVVIGHSYGGAVAAAFALRHPARTAGLVLVSAATHPWPGGRTSWYYEWLAAHPRLGRLFAETLLVPLGLRRMDCALGGVFSPQPVPDDYDLRSGTALAIRPRAFLANARDVTSLHGHFGRTAPRYGEIGAPTIIITGDEDAIVHGPWHSEPMSLAVRGSRLVVVPGLGHKPDYYATGLVLEAARAVTHGTVSRFTPAIPAVPRARPAPRPETVEDGLETTPGTAALVPSKVESR